MWITHQVMSLLWQPLFNSWPRSGNVREALEELWEEGEGQLNFGIVFVCRFSMQFYSLQAGNYHERFRCMRSLLIFHSEACCCRLSYFWIIANVDTYSRINYSESRLSSYICRLLNFSITVGKAVPEFWSLVPPVICLPVEKDCSPKWVLSVLRFM